MGRCEWGTHFSTHASLEFFSLASIQKVSFSVVQSSLHDLRSRLYSNNNSSRIRMNISKISNMMLYINVVVLQRSFAPIVTY